MPLHENLARVGRALPGAKAVRDKVVARVPAARPYLFGPQPAATAAERATGMQATLGFTFPKDISVVLVGSGAKQVAEALRGNGFTSVRVEPTLSNLKSLADDSVRLLGAIGVVSSAEPKVIDELSRVASTVVVIERPQNERRAVAALEQRGLKTRATTTIGAETKEQVVELRRMEKQDSLHAFWRQSNPHGNDPSDYLRPVYRSRALRYLISDLPGDSRILEVGCNVGRNLAYLNDHGYPNVAGIEISPHAVEMLRESYPQLADKEIHLGAAGDILPSFGEDSLDLVFTMAVIEHLHPDEAKPVLDAMVRVGTHVLVIEPSNRLTHRQYPHDIVKEFTDRGMVHVSSTPMEEAITKSHEPGTEADPASAKAMNPFVAYRFIRPSA